MIQIGGFSTVFLINIVLASEKFKENICFINNLLWFHMKYLIFSKIFNTHLWYLKRKKSENRNVETTKTRVQTKN